MNDTSAYRGLNFDIGPRRIPPRILAVAVAFAIFTVMWWLIPQAALYWLILPLLLILVWTASYGWRPAVANLVKFLQIIERL